MVTSLIVPFKSLTTTMLCMRQIGDRNLANGTQIKGSQKKRTPEPTPLGLQLLVGSNQID